MKNPFRFRASLLNTASIKDTIQRALASAGLLGEPVAPVAKRALPSGFKSHTFKNDVGSRIYKLYIPKEISEAQPAMVVMLHGCTQSADDFAAGTQMNRMADEHGFLVVYPEQSSQANTAKCWNWFQPGDQMRDAGEPALIAGIVHEVAQKHGADPKRIFVAGLSAGGAMALVMAETYSDVFAGVGVHSGLPYASASDIPSALVAMKRGHDGKATQAVPLIVFHGDRDHTVQMSNSKHIVQEACEAYSAGGRAADLVADTTSGTAPGGRSFSRTTYADAKGQIRIESWTVNGAGHAWSGGDASGTYTDSKGPDASEEMVRFFFSLAA